MGGVGAKVSEADWAQAEAKDKKTASTRQREIMLRIVAPRSVRKEKGGRLEPPWRGFDP
jgi:hypothetical protein